MKKQKQRIKFSLRDVTHDVGFLSDWPSCLKINNYWLKAAVNGL